MICNIKPHTGNIEGAKQTPCCYYVGQSLWLIVAVKAPHEGYLATSWPSLFPC